MPADPRLVVQFGPGTVNPAELTMRVTLTVVAGVVYTAKTTGGWPRDCGVPKEAPDAR